MHTKAYSPGNALFDSGLGLKASGTRRRRGRHTHSLLMSSLRRCIHNYQFTQNVGILLTSYILCKGTFRTEELCEPRVWRPLFYDYTCSVSGIIAQTSFRWNPLEFSASWLPVSTGFHRRNKTPSHWPTMADLNTFQPMRRQCPQ